MYLNEKHDWFVLVKMLKLMIYIKLNKSGQKLSKGLLKLQPVTVWLLKLQPVTVFYLYYFPHFWK